VYEELPEPTGYANVKQLTVANKRCEDWSTSRAVNQGASCKSYVPMDIDTLDNRPRPIISRNRQILVTGSDSLTGAIWSRNCSASKGAYENSNIRQTLANMHVRQYSNASLDSSYLCPTTMIIPQDSGHSGSIFQTKVKDFETKWDVSYENEDCNHRIPYSGNFALRTRPEPLGCCSDTDSNVGNHKLTPTSSLSDNFMFYVNTPAEPNRTMESSLPRRKGSGIGIAMRHHLQFHRPTRTP